METNNIMELILPNLVDGLFAAIITAVLAGIIIWLIQKKYEKRLNMDSFYQDRLRQEEDKFYSYIQAAKVPYYQMLKSMTNNHSDIQSAAIVCVSAIQTACDLAECDRAVLGKYTEKTRNILELFNDFINKFQDYYNNMDKNIKDMDKRNVELKSLSDKVRDEFDAIDRIYFYNEK